MSCKACCFMPTGCWAAIGSCFGSYPTKRCGGVDALEAQDCYEISTEWYEKARALPADDEEAGRLMSIAREFLEKADEKGHPNAAGVLAQREAQERYDQEALEQLRTEKWEKQERAKANERQREAERGAQRLKEERERKVAQEQAQALEEAQVKQLLQNLLAKGKTGAISGNTRRY